MKPSHPCTAPSLRIEPENEWAWCGDRRLVLMPKAFAVLTYLVDRAGRLITKDELLAAVWRDTVVSEAALSSCIRDLRRALGDSSEAPRYIETVHRRGFRFIGPVAGGPGAAVAGPVFAVERPAAPALVGRDTERARLHRLVEAAMRGQRQLVFVTGEPGIGKTALVDAVLAEIDTGAAFLVGRGQCVEQYGAGEAYLPVLEALGRLGRGEGGDRIVQVLKQHAPTWLAQLPALLHDDDLAAVQRRSQGTTRERMLRELVEGLDALTRESPLALVLEDVHWSDSATVELLAMLARRREPARLLVLATYRPADVSADDHPLKAAKRELQLHGRCEEIALDFLGVDGIVDYLGRRFGPQPWPPDFARLLHERTDGNPLFLVNILDDLLVQGKLREVDGQWALMVPVKELAVGTPDTFRHIVEKQVERLTADEQAMLAIASVAGVEFSAAIATVDGLGVDEGERRCHALARRGQFLRAAGVAEWPDGTVAGRYTFIHALYQQVLYARVPVGRRVALHLHTGDRLERAYGTRVAEIAGELAMHFEHGRDSVRAARYHEQAGEAALRHHGYREAAHHLTRALALLGALPDTQERRQREVALQLMLGSALTPQKGIASRDVERAYARARELCDRIDDSPRLIPMLRSLAWFYLVRGALDSARDLGQRLLGMEDAARDPGTLASVCNTLGLVAFYGGAFADARAEVERGAEAHASAAIPSSAPHLSLDARASCALHAAWTLWVLGFPDQAVTRLRDTMALATALEHPFSLAHAHRFAAAFQICVRDHEATLGHADAAIAIAGEHGFPTVMSGAMFCRGWVRADRGEEDGLALMRDGVQVCRDIRAGILIPSYLGWLAEACGKLGQREEGLELVAEALEAARASTVHYWTAELHRVRGELTAADKDAEASFTDALALARQQGARALELRATTSMSRLWMRQGKSAQARALLSGILDRFTEGFGTADVREAAALLGARPGVSRGARAR